MQVRGLMFCSSVEEANALSRALNDTRLVDSSITGIIHQAESENAIDDLKRWELRIYFNCGYF